ncbi:MAG TPA: tRNA lysidine(34) synthetase TilS [Pyrinomonadaceae bacterium]|nr:tRNA lysidine(34) synthetase TilS [Pyrinomonadaceae bacterium]
MNKFVRNLITEWRRLGLPATGATAVVAVSGGADSSALIAALRELERLGKLDLRLIAAHFDHGLRGAESRADRDFAAEFTERLGVEFIAGSGQIRKRGNLEENARNARYEFLRETVKKTGATLLVTGHTMNDQAETFLINLIRGSGSGGLAAMKAVRKLSEDPSVNNEGSGLKTLHPLLVRPMLRWAKRADTEAFCRENSIEFRRDPMNDDPAFTRVRVRKALIPMLEEFNPNMIETLASTAELLRENQRESDRGDHPQADTLSLAELKTMEKHELYGFLRVWLKSKRGNLRGLTLKHIAGIERLLHSRKSGKAIELPRGQTVSRDGGRLVFTQRMVEK